VLTDGDWIVLRVPYPMGFYTKWLDGRIDDPGTSCPQKGLAGSRFLPHTFRSYRTPSRIRWPSRPYFPSVRTIDS
jgi:hypothetical protein